VKTEPIVVDEGTTLAQSSFRYVYPVHGSWSHQPVKQTIESVLGSDDGPGGDGLRDLRDGMRDWGKGR
jgi:hypothetical protein